MFPHPPLLRLNLAFLMHLHHRLVPLHRKMFQMVSVQEDMTIQLVLSTETTTFLRMFDLLLLVTTT